MCDETKVYKLTAPVRFTATDALGSVPTTVRAESYEDGGWRCIDSIVYPKAEEAAEQIAKTLNYLVAGTVELALRLMSEELQECMDGMFERDDEILALMEKARARVMQRLSEMPDKRYGPGTEKTGAYGPTGYGALYKQALDK